MIQDTEKIVTQLDRLYWSDSHQYNQYCNNLKSYGYRIFRNSEGKHIVKNDVMDFFGNLFGGFNK